MNTAEKKPNIKQPHQHKQQKTKKPVHKVNLFLYLFTVPQMPNLGHNLILTVSATIDQNKKRKSLNYTKKKSIQIENMYIKESGCRNEAI